MVGTNDLKLSEEFYDKLLETVGLKKYILMIFVLVTLNKKTPMK